MTQTQNQTQGTRETVLGKDRMRDVIEFNEFWASTPAQVRLVYEEEPNNGLWQLILYDMRRPRSWRIGYYLDGYEGRRTLYDMVLTFYYGRYIDDSEQAKRYSITNDIIRESGGMFVINLPDEWRPDVVIRIPTLCRVEHPLVRPVYIGTLDSRFFVLDCASGIHYFDTLEELENWIREHECRQHETPIIHWYDWGILQGDATILYGYSEPTVDEVIQFLRQNLRPT